MPERPIIDPTIQPSEEIFAASAIGKQRDLTGFNYIGAVIFANYQEAIYIAEAAGRLIATPAFPTPRWFGPASLNSSTYDLSPFFGVGLRRVGLAAITADIPELLSPDPWMRVRISTRDMISDKDERIARKEHELLRPFLGAIQNTGLITFTDSQLEQRPGLVVSRVISSRSLAEVLMFNPEDGQTTPIEGFNSFMSELGEKLRRVTGGDIERMALDALGRYQASGAIKFEHLVRGTQFRAFVTAHSMFADKEVDKKTHVGVLETHLPAFQQKGIFKVWPLIRYVNVDLTQKAQQAVASQDYRKVPQTKEKQLALFIRSLNTEQARQWRINMGIAPAEISQVGSYYLSSKTLMSLKKLENLISQGTTNEECDDYDRLLGELETWGEQQIPDWKPTNIDYSGEEPIGQRLDINAPYGKWNRVIDGLKGDNFTIRQKIQNL